MRCGTREDPEQGSYWARDDGSGPGPGPRKPTRSEEQREHEGEEKDTESGLESDDRGLHEFRGEQKCEIW